ncbi:multidrug effflux MFS transporter [Amorphus orientalis]|uniref:Bcr/CflA family efflux transporter n=1 Tax=Amorphus orientalis TaxID=649198 RepID=A0AAE4ASS9_9HYPH|nr:multidrug effflux MFS transporter [Amorphus orientalis]MDQ0316601.1 DHA1 family bicyclomycin/chloramphenicol resistance-like MFS transporter [Amorphus orientalis]
MLKPGTIALTALLATLQAVGPIATDTYLPSLPSIAVHLDASISTVQLTLSVFLIGFALAQIVYGPVSDRFGRKPVLIVGLALYCAASFACAVASSIELLIVARFFQALGAAGPVVLSRSMVRDLYEGRRAGTELSRMGTIMGLMPAVAPSIGGVLDLFFGWRGPLFAVFALAIVILLLVIFRLPETIRERVPERLTPKSFLWGFGPVISDAGYRVHVAIVCFTYAGIFVFISGGSFVLQNVYGLSSVVFGLVFGMCALSYVAGTLLGQRLLQRLGVARALGVGCCFLAAGGTAMVLALVVGIDHPAAVVVPQMIYLVGVGQALPQGMAGALMPFTKRAGAASSLLGFTQMVFSAGVGTVLGLLLHRGALPMALFLAVCGIGALATYLASRNVRARGPQW